MDSVVAAARAALGPVGVYLPGSLTEPISMPEQLAAVKKLEELDYRVVWTNEPLGGKDVLVQVGVLLGATKHMVFGTGIANIWAREPQTTHGAAALLAQAFPGRFVLGQGVGYPQQAAAVGREFGRPLHTMRDYTKRMFAETWPPAPQVGYPRIIAANRPKMLALAGEISDGAMPAGMPPSATAQARKVLGADKLLVVGLTALPGADRARVREHATATLAQPGYAAALSRLGYADTEISEVSDRLVDAIIASGSPSDIAAQVRAHRAAGADHVAILPPLGTDFAVGIDQLEQLAPALTAIQ